MKTPFISLFFLYMTMLYASSLVSCSSSTPVQQTPPASFTLKGTIEPLISGETVLIPSSARVVCVWSISSSSPDYNYISGVGTVQPDNRTFEITLHQAPPDSALNSSESFQLGVAAIILLKDSTIQEGFLPKTYPMEKNFIGGINNTGLIYRRGAIPSVIQQKNPWVHLFPEGFTVGKGVKFSPFDKFEPIQQQSFILHIEQMRYFVFPNWS